jgi:outer membrane protein
MKFNQRNTLRLRFLMVLSLFFSVSTVFSQEKVWSLEDCISYALENNIQVQQNELNQQISKQDVISSKSNLLPNLNGFASHTYNFGQTIDPFTNSFATTQVRSNSFSLSSSLTLFNGFQNINSVKRSQAQLESSRYDLEKMKNDISLNIANAYLQILFNQELLKNAENQLQVTQIQIDRIAKQVRAGSLPEGSLKDIEAQYASEELQKVNAENQLGLSKLNLAQLLRLESTVGFEIQSPDLTNFQGVSELISPEALYATAVETMPEVKSAEYSLYSAEQSKRLARGTYFPTLTLNSSIGSGYSGANTEVVDVVNPRYVLNGDRTLSGELIETPTADVIRRDKSFGDQLDDNFNKSVGFSLRVPLFNGFSSRTSVQRAKLQMQIAELNLENTKLQLRQSIESAHNDAVAALKRYRAAEKSVDALETSFRYTQERFNVGLVNSFEFNNEKNRLNNAKSELLQAKFNYIFSTRVLDFYQGKAISLSK